MKNKKKQLDYDPAKDNKFSANIKFDGYSVSSEFEVDLSTLQDRNMMYDDVIDAMYSKLESFYPNIDFSASDDIFIYIFCNETQEWCPVLSESMKDEIKKLEKSKRYSRFLVLPEATYTLTPEMKLFLVMQKNGMIDEEAKFDFDSLHEMLKNTTIDGKSIK